MPMFESTELTATPAPAPVADLERLVGVHVDVTVELGRTQMTLGEALEIGPGAVIPLDRTAGSPLTLKVNGQLVARGEVVVIDDVYGLRITEIADQGGHAHAPAELEAPAVSPESHDAPADDERLAA